VKVWKGQKDEIDIYPRENASFVIQQSQKNLLKWEIHAPSDVTAPIKADQQMGEIVFLVSDQAKRTVALASREDILLGGWFKRSWQTVVSLRTIGWRWLSRILAGIAIAVVLLTLQSRRKSKKKFAK